MWNRSPIPFIHNDHALIMAHRGDSSQVPENTLPAFEEAYQLGVDCIETDVRMTKDQQLVLLHDNHLIRTTNGKGTIDQYILTELKQLDAGYRFVDRNNKADPYPYRGKGLQLQTFEEIVPQFPNVRFNFDIKPKDPEAPRILAKAIEALQIEDRIMVGSFFDEQIQKFRTLCTVPTSAAPKEVWQFRKVAYKWLKTQPATFTEFTDDPIAEQEQIFHKPLPFVALQIPENIIVLKIITPLFVRFAHRVGIAVMVWTINEEKDMQRLLEWGVDGIFTDKPESLLKIIKA